MLVSSLLATFGRVSVTSVVKPGASLLPTNSYPAPHRVTRRSLYSYILPIRTRVRPSLRLIESIAGLTSPDIMATSAKAAPSTAASSGTKRKRASESKFYAVAKGHTPGVYNSWADCQQQTTGFKGAKCELPVHCSRLNLQQHLTHLLLPRLTQTPDKSFTSLGDAEAYAKGN